MTRARIGVLIASLVSLAVSAAMLIGCAGADLPGSSEPRSTGQEPDGSVQRLHLMVAQSRPDNDVRLTELVASLNELNPTLQISLTISANYEADLAAAVASQNPPDVFLTTSSQLPELVASGDARKIPAEWIERTQLLRAVADAIEIEGDVYCFPHSVHTNALLYNRDLFAQGDRPVPTIGWDWQSLATAASALTNPEEGNIGLVLYPSPTSWLPFYLQAGGAARFGNQRDPVFDPDPAREAAIFMAQLFAEGGAARPSDLGAAWSGEAFAGGGVGMVIEGDWILPYLEANPPPFSYGVVELPEGPAQRGNVAFVNCIAVHSDSSQPDLALQLAQQLTAPEVLPGWTNPDGDGLSVYIPQDIAAEADSAQLEPFLRALRYATPWRYGSFAAEYGDRFAEGMDLVINEEIAPEEYWAYLLQSGLPVAPQ